MGHIAISFVCLYENGIHKALIRSLLDWKDQVLIPKHAFEYWIIANWPLHLGYNSSYQLYLAVDVAGVQDQRLDNVGDLEVTADASSM